MKTIFTLLILLFWGMNSFSQSDTIIASGTDGRFTLGVKQNRLMYGYPNPLSTSHFVVKINRNFASNRPGFANAWYLRDDLKQVSIGNSWKTFISYTYDNVKITQRLIPVTRQLKEIKANEIPQYYKVEYELENLSDYEKHAGLMLFFDTQVAENDACWMEPKTASFFDVLQTSPVPKAGLIDRVKFGLFGGKYGREHLYSGTEVPPIILAYRNKWKKTQELTSVFITSQAEATVPDDLMVCRWPFYYSVLWDYSNTNSQNIKYTDSAVLMKWKDFLLKAGEKKRLATYYGIYSPDTLAIRSQESYNTFFAVTPNVITEGDKTNLRWETQNRLNASISITDLNGNQPNQGSSEIAPSKSTVYEMKMVYNGKVIGSWTAPVTVLPKPSKVKTEDDGRFTLGWDNNSFTFGYPLPYSTSHFLVNSNQKIASNYANVGAEVEYLKGSLKINEAGGSPQSFITYSFDSLVIAQKMTAVNKYLEELPIDSLGRYYKIEYTILSQSKKKKDVGFGLMLDLAIKGNDAGVYKTAKGILAPNTFLTGKIPSEIAIYSDSAATQPMGQIMLNETTTDLPNEVSLGLWQQLNTTKWNVNQITKDYTHDYALLLKWNARKMNYENPLHYTIYVGNKNIVGINLNHHRKEDTKTDAVFFASGKSDLTKQSIETLKNLLKNETYAYFVVEGFTDPTGSEEMNYKLSQKRVKAVVDYLTNQGVPDMYILRKSHGEFYAGKASKTDSQERKVQVTLYRKMN